MDYTPNINLYKWNEKDSKRSTIAEMASNADKIDAKFNEHATQMAETLTLVSDSTQLQSKIDSLVNGGTVRFAQGKTYIIDNIIVTNDNITFEGNGAVLKKSQNTKMFDISNRKNIKFRDLTFDLQGFNTSASYAIYGDVVTNIELSKCSFKNGGYGVNLKNISDVTMEKCTFDTFTYWGNFFSGNINGLKALNNKSFNSQYDGIKIGTEQNEDFIIRNVQISGNECYGNVRDGLDIAVSGGENISIVNNNFHDNSTNGIDFKIIYQGVETIRNAKINSNILIGNTGIGINCQANFLTIEKITVSDNTIERNDLAATGIRLFNVSKSNVFNNKINKGGYGIRVINCDSCKVFKNEITDTYSRGVIIETQTGVCNNNEVHENQIVSTIAGHGNLILVASVDCNNNKIYNNRLKVTNDTYPTFDSGTGTIRYENIVGEGSTPPARASVGEVFIVSPLVAGGYTKQVCITAGKPATWKGAGLIQA